MIVRLNKSVLHCFNMNKLACNEGRETNPVGFIEVSHRRWPILNELTEVYMDKNENDISEHNLTNTVSLSGGCLCGGVRYALLGAVRGVVNCFCQQCQKTSGHHVAATRVDKKNFQLLHSETLVWYESSPGIKRGFCGVCGGNLFWDDVRDQQLSVMAGSIDKPTGLKTVKNIYVQDASDYFEIPSICATLITHY